MMALDMAEKCLEQLVLGSRLNMMSGKICLGKFSQYFQRYLIRESLTKAMHLDLLYCVGLPKDGHI